MTNVQTLLQPSPHLFTSLASTRAVYNPSAFYTTLRFYCNTLQLYNSRHMLSIPAFYFPCEPPEAKNEKILSKRISFAKHYVSP